MINMANCYLQVNYVFILNKNEFIVQLTHRYFYTQVRIAKFIRNLVDRPNKPVQEPKYTIKTFTRFKCRQVSKNYLDMAN